MRDAAREVRGGDGALCVVAIFNPRVKNKELASYPKPKASPTKIPNSAARGDQHATHNTNTNTKHQRVCVCGGAPRAPRSPAVAVTGILSFR